MKRKYKNWWKKHWDEVMLVAGTIAGLILILIGFGVI